MGVLGLFNGVICFDLVINYYYVYLWALNSIGVMQGHVYVYRYVITIFFRLKVDRSVVKVQVIRKPQKLT